MTYQKIKGTQDFIGLDARKIRFIEETIASCIRNFGYQEIVTPIFEATEVFVKNVGESTDVVNKEMYTFLDKGGRSITLRPEGTAAVARSFIENKLYADPGIKKYYYVGPMFRYERPQVGRFRQFSQFGVEVYGKANALLDCDVISSAFDCFNKLGLRNVVLKINTIGDGVSRANYSKALKDYFAPLINDMCEDCKRRLSTNPLRILDCKVDAGSEAILNAPKLSEFLTEEAKQNFSEVLKCLDNLGIPYVIDEQLVRGLDYYTETVFEFIISSDDELNGLAIGGGGKYANMLNDMAGLDIPGIGYAFGIDRVKMLMEKSGLFDNLVEEIDLFIIGLDDESKLLAQKLCYELRGNGLITEMDYSTTSLKSQFKSADRLNAKYIAIIGETERNEGCVMLKNTKTKEQYKVLITDLFREITK